MFQLQHEALTDHDLILVEGPLAGGPPCPFGRFQPSANVSDEGSSATKLSACVALITFIHAVIMILSGHTTL